MTLEDIVESINKYIWDRRLHKGLLDIVRGHLVLHKSIIPSPLAKVYKVYEYTLWLVKPTDKYKVFTMRHQVRVTTGVEEEVTKEFENKFFRGLLKLIIDGRRPNSDKPILEEIIYGEYDGYEDEPVPDPLD